QNMVDDFALLLPTDMQPDVVDDMRGMALTQIRMARRLLDTLGEETDALEWWPQQQSTLGPLFSLAKMLFAIPVTSADNERSFSSAGFTLDDRRTRLELESFRSEHRVRRFIVACADNQTAEGRQLRLERVGRLLERFAAQVAERGEPAQ